jgi:hypothetical protein
MIVGEGESDDQVGWGWGRGERQTGRLQGVLRWRGRFCKEVTAMLSLLYRFFSSFFLLFFPLCFLLCFGSSL